MRTEAGRGEGGAMKRLSVCIGAILALAALAGIVVGCTLYGECAAGESGCASDAGTYEVDPVPVDPCEGQKNLEPCERGTCYKLIGVDSPVCITESCESPATCSGGGQCAHVYDGWFCLPPGTAPDYSCNESSYYPGGWTCLDNGAMNCYQVCNNVTACAAHPCTDTGLGFGVCVEGSG